MVKTCSVEGCNGKHLAKGYCANHYYQFKRNGYIPTRTRLDANEIIDCIDHAEIVIYDKQNKEIARAIIDSEYIELIKDYKWHLSGEGYVTNNKVGSIHRFLMNPPYDLVVDHINGNKLDNRRCNLRICTQHHNSMNHSVRKNNTSGVTGVTWYKGRNKWHASIMINGKNKHLGYFNTLEEATEARKQAEIDYYGEYRRVD